MINALLQDDKLTNSRYAGLNTRILFVHTGAGTFTGFNGDAMFVRLDNNEFASFLPSNLTIFTVLDGNKSTSASQDDLRAGDKVEIAETINAQTQKTASSRVTIRRNSSS